MNPRARAHGGLASSPEEFLADGTRNAALNFLTLDLARRGQYLFLGADSKYLGLNVGLQTKGTGAGLDLKWEYWNGAAWADLELFGFVDQTAHLTADGTLYWNEPAGWSPYSVNGGPDLYYVRVALAAGAYGTIPVEGVIKTDILLFQYCGDITAAAQTFQFPVPASTAVELVSFKASGRDRAVELSWETASELNNLGFHLYRSSSPEDTYERVTPRPIPGLGSSPSGASYLYLDEGLANGVTYSYQLEDLETTGRTKRHGPVSASPQEGVDAPHPRSTEGSSSRLTYGNPSASTLRVLDRGRNGVTLELRTEGFYATAEEDGSVRIEVPGFEIPPESGSAIPVKRAWVEAVAARKVTIASVRSEHEESFSSLHPAGLESASVEALRDGTVRASRRRRVRDGDAGSSSPARISSVGFHGDVKKAFVELAPIRWDSSAGRLLVARRLVVRLSFAERDPAEETTDGLRGRRYRRERSHEERRIVARLGTSEKGLYGVRYEEDELPLDGVGPGLRSGERR